MAVYLCKGPLFARSATTGGLRLAQRTCPQMRDLSPQPPDCNAALVLADGTVFWGSGFGARGTAVGEVCFNTAMTGYQEILTDPSYAGQIITFTFPHIGNVGTNHRGYRDRDAGSARARVRSAITDPANWRATQPLDGWLEAHGLDRDFGDRHQAADPADPRSGRRPTA